jgi:drug/metabolite transporter (DMT)-like permease
VTGQRDGLGITLILLMAACFTASDSIIKYLGDWLPVLLVLWLRYAFQAVVMGFWLAASGLRQFRSTHPRFQFVRGALLLATSGLLFFGVQLMPLAEFTALGMLTPVVATLLAAWFLHDRVSRLRWALVWGGFAGALIVIRPGSGVFGWAAALPLLMALCYGSFQVLTSKFAALESPYTTHFYTGLWGTVLLAPVLFAGVDVAGALRAATVPQIGLALAIGAFNTTGHLLLIFAFRVARTATLMPFTYAQIGYAVAASWLVFRHVPDAWAWVGIGVITTCGAASAWLNVRAAAERARTVQAVMAGAAVD